MPYSKNSFFGRQQYLDVMEKRLRHLIEGYRQNVAIIGDELSGKTSIVFQFLSKFCDNRVVILYLQTRPESFESFAKRYMGVLLYNFLANSAVPLEEDLCFLVGESEKYIPRTCARIRFILSALERRKKANILTELFGLCELIHEETGKFCCVILDEFQNLENMGLKNVYAEWSKLLILQKNTMYIIVSSMKFRAKEILSKNLSLLFGNFEVVTVEPFDIKTSEDYLGARLSALNIGAGLKNFIIHFTGGCPFYLEIITDALLKSGRPNMAEIIEGILFQDAGILNQRFSSYLKRFLDTPNSQDYLSILYAVASGHNKLKDIAHILRKTRKEINSRANYLLGSDAVSRNGDFLKINDRVLGFWLKFVYQEKLQSLTFDAQNQVAQFRNRIEAMIQEFLLSSQKPVIDRVKELLQLFDDDTIQMERKRLRLSHFREIKPTEFSARRIRDGLIGRSNDSLWIMAFKNDLLTESDISDFARECKKYRHKLQRKIIVTLRDIDANARLRALEEKILMWDINSLNQILDLFSKPRIVL